MPRNGSKPVDSLEKFRQVCADERQRRSTTELHAETILEIAVENGTVTVPDETTDGLQAEQDAYSIAYNAVEDGFDADFGVGEPNDNAVQKLINILYHAVLTGKY